MSGSPAATAPTTPGPPVPDGPPAGAPPPGGPPPSPGDRADGADADPGDPAREQAADADGNPPEQGKSADQSGSESDRQEYRRDAQRRFGGDLVSGDKVVLYLSGGDPGAPLRPLSPTLIELARHAFVPPPEWERCRLDFRDRRTVLLRGAPGHGRDTLAIRLLQTVEAQTILELDRRVDLTRMAERIAAQRLRPRTAFLLSQPDQVDHLDAYTLHSLEATLQAADARLVVTVSNEVSFADEDLLRYQLTLPPAPQRLEILSRHLGHLAGEARAEQLLRDREVAAFIAEQLDGDAVPCRVAALLAWLLSRAPDPVDVAQVRTLLRRRSTDQFDLWFDSLEPLEVRCFAIALAVLDGLPYEEVAAAARLLYDALDSGGPLVLGAGAQLRVATPDPFGPDPIRLERVLQAQVDRATIRTPYGPAPATTIAYRDPDYPRRVIERAWRYYRVEDRLLGWLGRLVTAGSEQVSVHAGAALGMLAANAFEYVRARALVPWAYDRAYRRNQAVAEALRIAVTVPELQAAAVSLVDTWYGSGDPDAQCTAALALGTGLGRADAAASVQALERLAMVDHPSVRLGIAHGFAALLVADPVELAPRLYAVVGRCLADRARAHTGQLVFLRVALQARTEVRTPAGTPARWPTLLYLAREHARLREPLCTLWARTLTEGPAVDLAREVLRSWAGYAEADADLREAFTRMIRGIARLDQRAGAVLGRCARQWNSDEELLPLPATALAVGGVVPG